MGVRGGLFKRFVLRVLGVGSTWRWVNCGGEGAEVKGGRKRFGKKLLPFYSVTVWELCFVYVGVLSVVWYCCFIIKVK